MESRTRITALGGVVVFLSVAVYLMQSPAQTAEEAKAAANGTETSKTTPPEISLVPKNLEPDSSGRIRTSSKTIEIDVTTNPATAGEVTVFVNNFLQSKATATNATTTVSGVKLTEGENAISVSLKPTDKPAVPSSTIFVTLDTVGPMLQHAEVIETPATGTILIATFADDDFTSATDTLNGAFEVKRRGAAGEFSEAFDIQGTPTPQGRTVRLTLAPLPPGEYRLTVKNALTDIAGNHAGGSGTQGADKHWTFSVLAERKFGQHVEFPPYAPPKKQTIPPEGFNPDDYVQTRVARLYYYRDAHRVAEIINRNVRSYNQAAVTQAERRAEDSRDAADDATDKRRKAEREAVRAAEQARSAEQKLAATQQVLGVVRQLEFEIGDKEKRSKEIQQKLAAARAAAETANGLKTTAEEAAATARTSRNQANEAGGAKAKAEVDEQAALVESEQANDQAALDERTASDAEEKAQAFPDDVRLKQAATQLRDAANASKETAREKATAAQTASVNAKAAKDTADIAERAAAGNEKTAKEAADTYRAAATKAAEEAAAVQRDKLETEEQQLEKQLENLRTQRDRIGTVENMSNSVDAMQQSVANLRQTELVKEEAAAESDAAEARARAKQFRDEVTAAETDPDTYVAGDINSVDPVTQVSISVIGEGLIQLRGPIKGINKIRTMINEIDSPVGQIKIGVFTVQVNGEKGDKMEKVVGDAEGHIDLSRFLVNQSLELLRRSIQTEAAMIAEQCAMEGHYQVDRDRRYLYTFFGRDFIDELYEMNSEFLFSENKVLSLHAMDTVSLNRALFILALAKNDVRERIVARFLESAQTDLADAEYDFRRSSELKPHRTQKMFPPWNRTHLPLWNTPHEEQIICEAVHRNAMQRYHFRNVHGFFDVGFTNPDTMNPMQREFIRLAQIFKARLVAEMELKQRVIERGLIEDRSNDEDQLYRVLTQVRDRAYRELQTAYDGVLDAGTKLATANAIIDATQRDLRSLPSIEVLRTQGQKLVDFINSFAELPEGDLQKRKEFINKAYQADEIKGFQSQFSRLSDAKWLASEEQAKLKSVLGQLDADRKTSKEPNFADLASIYTSVARRKAAWEKVPDKLLGFSREILNKKSSLDQLDKVYNALVVELRGQEGTEYGARILELSGQLFHDKQNLIMANNTVEFVKGFLNDTRAPLDHRKLLNHLIDEQEDKFIELVEGTRSHIAVMDNYLKRLSIALEDDFKVQFYDPAFVRIREAARSQQVTLGQVERTTILTNNRAFAKVDPQATMEFDLPKRQIAIKEAFDAAKALVEDTGALVNDPTFLAAFQMMGGAAQAATVKSVIPGQSSSTNQQEMGLVPQQEDPAAPGSALQSLVPEPAIYKLETGTGFQIRPVIQPDGDSVVYDFDYMYTTNIREPVRADEKHLGRIKRHFVHTEVQTSNFELREISRYLVALKVSRTSRGVPLLEDIPVLGAAFRPAPSAESSIQQNIILGQTNVYPTLFDLMGLRWAPQVVDLDHTSLLEAEHVVRGRQKTIRDYVFEHASRRVDEFLDVRGKTPDNYRPDLYHEKTLSSPHHPSGYTFPDGPRDPTGNGYERLDRRPQEMQEPPYDRYRHQPVNPEPIGPQPAPMNIPLDNSSPQSIELRPSSGRLEDGTSRRSLQEFPLFGADFPVDRHSIPSQARVVVPASFEQADGPDSGLRIRRLPPVGTAVDN